MEASPRTELPDIVTADARGSAPRVRSPGRVSVPAPGEENANLLQQSSCGPLHCADSGSRSCPRRARAAGARPAAPGSSLLGKCGKRALNSTTSLPYLWLAAPSPRHRSRRCRRPRVEARVLCCLSALLAGSLLAEHPKLLDNCHCDRGNPSVDPVRLVWATTFPDEAVTTRDDGE